jgi:hypothetical protein
MTALTDLERNKICEEEFLRFEIRHKIENQDKNRKPTESRFSKLFQHQAVLLALGFFFTTCAGSWLTYYWKSRESIREREYLETQHILQKGYEVLDSVVQAVAETKTAAEDVIANYQWKNWRKNELDARRSNWLESSRKWRINSNILQTRLLILFPNSKVQDHFKSIVMERRLVGNIITNLLTNGFDNEEDANMEIKDAIERLGKIQKLAEELGRQIAHDIKGTDSIR